MSMSMKTTSLHTLSRTQSRGFTLVETLVAITILMLVIIGPVTVAQKGIQNSYYANEQVTAVYLAQEAIEAVRQKRDTVALDVLYKSTAGTLTWSWLGSSIIPDDCKTTGCAYDVTGGNFETCGSNNQCKLKFNNGIYQYGSGTDSPFTRKVYVGSGSGNNPNGFNYGVPVTVEVTWSSHSGQHSVVLQTWIYDQYKIFQ